MFRWVLFTDTFFEFALGVDLTPDISWFTKFIMGVFLSVLGYCLFKNVWMSLWGAVCGVVSIEIEQGTLHRWMIHSYCDLMDISWGILGIVFVLVIVLWKNIRNKTYI